MLRMLLAAAVMTAAAALGDPARAADSAMVVKESQADFGTTLQRLQAEIEKRQAKIVATVDHAAGAKAQGLELRPTTVVVFGNPLLGTPLMQAGQTAGLDLPLRILVWEDAGGTVRLGYWPPARLAEQHTVTGQDEVVGKMTGALDAITEAAAAP